VPRPLTSPKLSLNLKPGCSPPGSMLATAAEASQAFLQEAGASDEADFHARLAIFRKRRELSAIVQACEARIGQPAGNAQEWTGELSRVAEMLAETQKRRDEAVREQGIADAERRRIAESDAVSALKGELEGLHTASWPPPSGNGASQR